MHSTSQARDVRARGVRRATSPRRPAQGNHGASTQPSPTPRQCGRNDMASTGRVRGLRHTQQAPVGRRQRKGGGSARATTKKSHTCTSKHRDTEATHPTRSLQRTAVPPVRGKQRREEHSYPTEHPFPRTRAASQRPTRVAAVAHPSRNSRQPQPALAVNSTGDLRLPAPSQPVAPITHPVPVPAPPTSCTPCSSGWQRTWRTP